MTLHVFCISENGLAAHHDGVTPKEGRMPTRWAAITVLQPLIVIRIH